MLQKLLQKLQNFPWKATVPIVLASLLIIVLAVVLAKDGKKGEGNDRGATVISPLSHQEESLIPRVQEFTLKKKGDRERTVHVGSGTYHVIQANKPFLAHSATKGLIEMGTRSDWQGAAPDGLLLIEAKENGTKVTFIKER